MPKPIARFAATTLLLAACAGGSDTPDAKVTVGESNVAVRDACQIMTAEIVSEVYGETMTKSERNIGASGPSADVSTCTYQNSDVLRLATLMVTSSKSTSGPLASRDEYALSAEKDVPPDLRQALAVEKVDFQGLPALWQAGQLKVFKDGVMLSILADPASGQTAKQTMEAIMTRLISRL